jgi:hypothetical protein
MLTLERKRLCSIDEVFNFIGEDTDHACIGKDFKHRIIKEFEKDIYVRTNSERYATFKKSLTCSCCGLKGQYFALEKAKNSKSYHFNLYGVDENGNEVLFTKDHIVPKSKGGENDVSNYQTMCEVCNFKKADTMEV